MQVIALVAVTVLPIGRVQGRTGGALVEKPSESERIHLSSGPPFDVGALG